MKNIILLLLTTISSMACGQKNNSADQKIVGLWKGTSKETKDRAQSPPGSAGSKILKNLMIIEFKENHDVIYPDLPSENYKNLKFEVAGNKLQIGIGCYLIEKITDSELVLLELNAFCKDDPLAFRLFFKK